MKFKNDHRFGWEAPYLSAVQDAVYSKPRQTRNGEVQSSFIRLMEFDLRKGFPLLMSKTVNFELIKAELLWFIEGGDAGGRMSFHRLEQIYGKPIKQMWRGDMENFAHKAKFEGDCGRIYGAQWRKFKKYIPTSESSGFYRADNVDQLKNLINLIKTDPNSRYMRVSAWNPGELDDMSLPACHTDFQCYVGDGRLSLNMNQRSCDMFLGVPFNIASYALLCHMLAQVCGLNAGTLSIVLNDYHVYKDHLESVKSQIQRAKDHGIDKIPKLWLNPAVNDIDKFRMEDIQILDYEPLGVIAAPVLTKNLK